MTQDTLSRVLGQPAKVTDFVFHPTGIMDIDWRKEYTREGHRVTLAGSSIVMHCHHYNINLQKMLEDTLGERGVDLMIRAAESASRNGFESLLRHYPQIRTAKSRMELAETMYQICGLGVLHFREAEPQSAVVESLSSHHVTGWLAKHGRRATPGCHFTRGWIAGVLSVLFQRKYLVSEKACKLVDSPTCCFIAIEGSNGG